MVTGNDRTRGSSGFTMVELLVTITVVGALAGLAFQMFTYSYKVSKKLSEEYDMRSQGMTVLREITSGFKGTQTYPGLYGAETITFQDAAASATLDYTTESGATVTYVWDKSARTLTRDSKALLDNVESLSACWDTGLVNLSLVQKHPGRIPVSQVDLESRFHPRHAASTSVAMPACP